MNSHRLGTRRPRRGVFVVALAVALLPIALLPAACTPESSGTQDADPVRSAWSQAPDEPTTDTPAAPYAPDGPAGSLPATEEPTADAGARSGSPWSLPYPDAPGDIAANGLLVVVNKVNQLVPHDYRPADLVRVSGHYVAEVAAESLRDLLPMYGHPCYDFACFGETPHAAWLAQHSWEFGWIVRYKPGMEHVTGVTWEPWHLRYLGREAAAAYHLSGATSLEEFLGLPAAPDYLD